MTLKNVRYVPDSGVNILSISRFTEAVGNTANTTQHQMVLLNDAERILQGEKRNGLFITKVKVET